MPLYEYTAYDSAGRKTAGFLDLPDTRSAKLNLRDRGMTLVRLDAVGSGSESAIKPAMLPVLMRQLSLLLRMGFTLDDAFETVSQSMGKRSTRGRLLALAGLLKEGIGLGQSLRTVSLFPGFYADVLTVAEKSGRLCETLEMLADHAQKKEQVRARWIQTLIYPAILLAAGLGVFVLMLNWVFPAVADLFVEMGRPLPVLSRHLLGLGEALRRGGWILLGILVALGIILARRRHLWLDEFLFKMPGAGHILKARNACTTAYHLWLLLRSGFSVPESFSLAGQGLRHMTGALERFRRHLEQGRPFEDNADLKSVLPEGFTRMLVVGYRNGRLPEACREAWQYFDRELDAAQSRITALAGPLILLITGSAIGILVIGTLWPILTWDFSR